MAEPPQAQAQDGTRDAGQSGQESGGAPAADLPESPVRERVNHGRPDGWMSRL